MDSSPSTAAAVPRRPLTQDHLRSIAEAFTTGGKFISGAPHGTGHINDTFAIRCQQAEGITRFILQRINQRVFRNVPALMSNIHRVTKHVAQKIPSLAAPHRHRRTLTIVPTVSGAAYHQEPTGECWRCYVFVERASTYDVLQHPKQAREAAYAFGHFQGLLADLGGERLHETIPHFHHTRRRFNTLLQSAEQAPASRQTLAQEELAFARDRERLVDILLNLQASGAIPERITHNDTKLNNVMLDDVTGEGVCVIDLDTVMPGLSLYDFGDMVRSATNSAAEDEVDLTRVQMQMPVFAALLDGYLSSAKGFLNVAEKEHLVVAAQILTFEVGIRFLADYLDGDIYFKTHRPHHNLQRARNQFALVRSMEAQQSEMQGHLEKLIS